MGNRSPQPAAEKTLSTRPKRRGTIGALVALVVIVGGSAAADLAGATRAANPPRGQSAHEITSVWAWGGNDYGQLGDGTMKNRYAPRQIRGLSGVVTVCATAYSGFAVKMDGTVWSWGRNSGSLGDGTTNDPSTPVRVLGITNVVGISAGGFHTLAMKTDGTVWA